MISRSPQFKYFFLILTIMTLSASSAFAGGKSSLSDCFETLSLKRAKTTVSKIYNSSPVEELRQVSFPTLATWLGGLAIESLNPPASPSFLSFSKHSSEELNNPNTYFRLGCTLVGLMLLDVPMQLKAKNIGARLFSGVTSFFALGKNNKDHGKIYSRATGALIGGGLGIAFSVGAPVGVAAGMLTGTLIYEGSRKLCSKLKKYRR